MNDTKSLENTPKNKKKTLKQKLLSIPNKKEKTIKIKTFIEDNKKQSSQDIHLEKAIKSHHNACEQLTLLRENLNKTRHEYDFKIKECEEELYGDFIKNYFNESHLTHQQLLKGLRKYYRNEKTNNNNFILSFQQFIDKFPQQRTIIDTNYKKQHVFEALCRLLLLFNFDKGELGNNKIFYKSLESTIQGNITILHFNNILSSKINEGSAAGKVDILFSSNLIVNEENNWACEEINYNEIKSKNSEKKKFVLIQNKYYDKEKSTLSDYDVDKIYTLYNNNKDLLSSQEGKIVLMVNNKESLTSKLIKNIKLYPDLLNDDNIYGILQLDKWFQEMLYELYKSSSIEEFIEKHGKIKDSKNSLQLRFHQKFITESTIQCINLENKRKFIWGAVPRSGKSYMIGGLISKRLMLGSNNDIVLILGAKTETLPQFVEMFEKFEDFSAYTIIVIDENSRKTGIKEGNKNIYLISQEWFKQKKIIDNKIKNSIDPSLSKFDEDVIDKFPKLFKKKQIDLYFDEVHKGGSTDNSESIIHAFHNADVKIDIFIMVTATFAKPNLRYTSLSFIDNYDVAEIIEWSYEDQQHMKNIFNETKKTMMINSRSGIQQTVLNDTFNYYNEYYGIQYLEVLAEEYKKHPELVLVTPYSINKNFQELSNYYQTKDIRNIFIGNLKCDACKSGETIEFYQNPSHIFKQVGAINDLLDYISKTVYNYFFVSFGKDIGTSHTQLWFLPDKDLYGTNTECKKECTTKEIVEGNMDEDQDKKESIPNIEPLTRGLAIKIVNHENFNRFNVFIVHNTNLKKHLKLESSKFFDNFNNRISMYNSKQGSLANQIKKAEKESYKSGKSLIILTGAKLRLGISLPCADIAFNFDDIKSVDNNYQTMFRVLTERTKPTLKKYGYYLDFNKDRSKSFLYEYNKIYGLAKKSGNFDEGLESLQSLLFTFNYNGLGLVKNNSLDELNLYDDLIKELELTKDDYINFWIQKENIVNMLKKSLINFDDNELLKDLAETINLDQNYKKEKSKKISKVLKEGKNIELKPILNKNDNIDEIEEEKLEDEIEEVKEVKEDFGMIIDLIVDRLPSIIVLLALFSQDFSCDNLISCVQYNIRNLDNLDHRCKCDDLELANIFDCYFNSTGLANITPFYKYDIQTLKNIFVYLEKILAKYEGDSSFIHNLNFIFANIKERMKDDKGLIYNMTYNDIEDKIQQYLTVRDEEKNAFGEVFTPTNLIENMINLLPKKVLSNPDLKWLDPANGIGNYPMVAYKILLDNLPDKYDGINGKYDGIEGKKKHIIKNMLYMIELNPKNVKISKKIFGLNANICCGNFETQREKCFKQFGVDKFDIIMGNPPFQDEIKEQDTSKPRKGGKNKLYERITVQCFSILNNNGYLLFVTPDNIMTGNTNKAYEEIIKYNTLFISFNNIQKTYFPKIGQSMCYFLIQKGKKNDNLKTKIINQNNDTIEVILKNRSNNPVRNWTLENEKNFTNYITDVKNNAVYYRGTTESKYTGGKYKVIYLPTRNNIYLSTNNEDLAPGINEKKIVLFESIPTSSGVMDYKGEYGVGPHTIYIPFKTNTEGKLLERFFKSDIYKNLVNSSQTSQYLKTSLITHLNLDKILLKRKNISKKAVTTEDISSSLSKTKKQLSLNSTSIKTRKQKHKQKGGKKKTKKSYSLFNLF
jgi:hypothetical protein